MRYSIVVKGEPGAALRSVLVDAIGAEAVEVGTDSLVVSLPDQSALVTAMSRLHDLGLAVDQVRSETGDPGCVSPDPGLPTGDDAS